VNTQEYIDAYPESLRQPEGVRKSFRILQNMSQEDHDQLLNLPSKGNLHKTVAAYGFLLQFAERFSDSGLSMWKHTRGRLPGSSTTGSTKILLNCTTSTVL